MKIHCQQTLTRFCLLLCAANVSSCTWSDPVRVEDDFGNSVRHMLEQQKQSQHATQTPSTSKPAKLDGNSAVNSLNQYRAAQKGNVQRESLDSFELNE